MDNTPSDASPADEIIFSTGNSFSSSNPDIPVIGIPNGFYTMGDVNDTNNKVSYTFPAIWFKTTPISKDVQNGYYDWQDFSGNNVKLRKYDSRGAAYGEEFFVSKNNLKTYNFNPALHISLDDISKEILNNKSNLAQTTIMGVWGPDEQNMPETDNFVFALNGRQAESIVFTKSNVTENEESGKGNLLYGNGLVKNLLFQPELANEETEDKFKEQSLRIATYYKANKPANSLWGEEQKSVISLGGDFDNNNVNNVSDFESRLNTPQKYEGYTPELLVFDKILTPKENQIFQTYLSLKYGISLDTTYIAPSGQVMWDYTDEDNIPFNNRIIGYTRQDALGLYQTTSTTAYEEVPYISSIKSNDSYDDGDFYNMSNRNKLLVVGNEPANLFNDGDYVMLGDNNGLLSISGTGTGNYGIIERQWLLKTNIKQHNNNEPQVLSWQSTSNFEIAEADYKIILYKPSSSTSAYAVTKNPLQGKDGYFGWILTDTVGIFTVKFGTRNASLTENSNDYGYRIKKNGQLYKIERGFESDTCFNTVAVGQKIEIEKTGNLVYLRIDGKRIKESECLITKGVDMKSNYYGGISIETPGEFIINNLRYGGFSKYR
ncbi:MAG: hypothetical protein QM751_13630 [Paludibacteraceae bacterium]